MSVDPGAVTDRPVVGSYPTYEAAQKAVDFLSDNKFPVEHTAIIGNDLRMIETVTGRLTWARAAIGGVSSGAWIGLLVGVLLSAFGGASTSALGVVLGCVVFGAIFGLVFGLIAHGLTGGRRDFTSRSKIQASRYEVVCDASHSEQAQNLLIKLAWREQ